jgi:hypothetical protein
MQEAEFARRAQQIVLDIITRKLRDRLQTLRFGNPLDKAESARPAK